MKINLVMSEKCCMFAYQFKNGGKMATFIKIVNGKKVEVIFNYRESCSHVYKTFNVYINDCKSNIRGLVKYLDDPLYPSILTDNTFYWRPNQKAASRRSRENRINNDVYDYMIKNGFKMV